MNYYKRHVKDYIAKTAHLSLLEHGVYTRLLDIYYEREQPLTRAEAVRFLRVSSDAEFAALDAVLADFFDLEQGAYMQSRVEQEFKDAAQVAAANKENGKKGGRPRKAKGKRTETDSVSDAKPSESEKNPNPLIHESTNPSIKDQKLLSSADDCPHAEILALYHEALPANPRMKVWAGKRQSALRARWREDAKRQSLDYWRRFFAHVAASRFLTGRASGKDGRTFLPGLDWLVLPENFAKVIEGRYHDQEAA